MPGKAGKPPSDLRGSEDLFAMGWASDRIAMWPEWINRIAVSNASEQGDDG
jgi:hypothetical protein